MRLINEIFDKEIEKAKFHVIFRKGDSEFHFFVFRKPISINLNPVLDRQVKAKTLVYYMGDDGDWPVMFFEKRFMEAEFYRLLEFFAGKILPQAILSKELPRDYEKLIGIIYKERKKKDEQNYQIKGIISQ